MSGRSSASRTKRADKDNGSSDTRDGSKTSKNDLRVDSQGYGKSKGDRSPSVRGGRGGRDRDDRGPRRERNDKPHGRNSRYDSRNDPESGDSWQDDRSYRKHDSKAFVDDSRLSKLVKKISREDDRDRRMTAAKQLKEFLLQPENAKTVVKASDNLLMALQDVFYERTYKDIKLEMAQCLGLVGYAMGRDAQRYVDWLFANLQAPQDDVKILLLTALLETLKHDAVSQKLLDILPTIMSKCQSILETADVPNLLIAVVEIVTYITKDHPHIFASHFTDTVDILVGWHIDSTQKEDLTTFTANALISFKQFWVADMNFSITLLGQFLEDMEAYAEDLCLGLKSETVDEDMPNTDECIIKIHALLRVFTTVMRCMGEYFMPNTSPAVTLEFMIEIVERIIHCIKEVLKVMYCEKVYMAANKCLHLLCTNLGSDYVHDICDGLTGFVVEESLNTRISGSQYLVSFLQLTKKMIEQLSTKLPMKVLSQLLGADSLLHKLRMTQNNLVLKELMSVYHTILGVKSVPLMEEAYRYLLSDLDIAFNTLLEKLESDTHCSLVMANPLSGLVYTPKQAESAIVFNICALAEVGNTKNNIIGMWALSPSIFNLFANHILPLYPPLMIQYPAIHFAVLQALYSHCSRHGHFISSSYLITQNTTLEGTLLANVNSTTNQHFVTVLALLVELQTEKDTPYDSSILALKWSQDIVDALQTSQHMYKSKELQDLLNSVVSCGFTENSDIAHLVCQCLTKLINHAVKMNSQFWKRCQDLCNLHLYHNNRRAQKEFQNLLNNLPIEIMATNPQHLSSEVELSKNAETTSSSACDSVKQSRRSHMSSLPMGTFHSHNFKTVMGYLLHGLVPRKKGNMIWLEQIYQSSQRSDKEQTASREAAHNLVLDNEAFLLFWATWESAQFCILSKLRTPLGKPQDTFTTIEAGIKHFAREALALETDEADNPHNNNSCKDIQDGYVVSKRVRLLMQFMEHLEKQLYNAYEGCAVSVVNPPKMVRTFFRTNRTTCQEWLGRIRQNLITVAHHCGDVSLVVRHTFEILQDLNDNNKVQSPEFKLNLVHCVEALITLRCPETIQGLYSWCKEVLGRKITWIKAASELASGKYELCIQDFKTSLSHYLCSESLPEEAKETDSNHDSEASTPSGSPKHLTEGIQKLSLLSRQSDNQLAVNSSKSGNSDSLEPCVVNFIVSQVSQSYEKICRWDDVLQWQEALKGYRSEYSDSPLKNAFAFHPDIKFIEALNHFEELDYEGARESLELVPGTSLQELDQDMKPSLPWSPNNIVNFSMKQHLRVVTATMLGYMNEEGESLLQCLEVTRKWCENIQKVSALDWPAQSQQGANIQQFISNLLKAFLNHYYGDPPGNKTFLRMYDDIKLDLQQHELDAVLKVLQSVNTVKHLQESLMYEQDALIDANTLLGQLHVSTVNLARKQQNYGLAEQLLVKEIANSIGIKSEELSMSESQDPLHEHLLKLQGTRENLNQIHCLKLERESVKLLRNKIANHVAIEAIVSSTLHHCKTIATLNPHQNRDLVAVCSDLNARSVLTLVQWLQTDPKYITQITNNLKLVGQDEELVVRKVVKDVASLLDIEKNWLTEMKSTTPSTLDEEEQYLSISDNPILADSDVVLGQLYHLATLQSPKLAKAWFALAGWCYKWGRKAVDHATHGSVELSTDEKAEVLDLLPKGISNEETESALSILSQIHTDSSSEEDISDQDQTLYDDGTETTRKQLLASCISLQIISDDKMDALIDFWKRVVQRVYHYYQLSAKAYFTYLKLNGQSFNVETNIDGNITATLRVLRLLVKHAWELRGVLEDGLAHTPTGPWKGIIPQLFSRLNHPEPYVRQSVSDLLCRVAQDSPHLIVYPAVVGCSSAKVKDADRDGLLNEYLSQNEDEEGIDAEESPEAEDDEAPEDENADILRNCFTTIVDTLARTNPGMIVEVQLLVNELRRVTLLWDELWLGTLNQHHADVNRRLQQLENEIKKVNNNNSLTKEEKAAIIKEKHKTIIKPTLFTMERLHEITSQPAETPHEKWFQENYGQLIQDGLERLRDPPKPTNPSFTWQQFKQLHHSLQQRAQRRTSLLLTMDEISPKLSTLKSTVIAMPGVSTSGEVVTIAGIHPTVQILPTKTKPKKLVFIGSDGKKHPYLFKGLEDLHLDERIMQFLAIVNNMFAKANRNHGRLYHARHYSVTPLGARSGLIQWVDGATPLFSLYKRWQQREAQAQQIKDQNAGQTTAVQPTIPRPSEVFYSKLNPALKEKGILNTDNRKDWPLNVLKNVLEDLVSETPKDLLAKELWCSSTSAREWWQITQTYSRSTAVMSMIGYIIGLGDRHLDNVLVDLVTGEVVHIDYNVCFEKGKSLRVPEKVPFRMTPNLVTALGVVGVEGIFRSTCEYVIRTMRKGRETLLTLLEAFVYDPLVDWTTGNEGGYTGAFYGGGHTANSSVARQPSKRDMEREITHSMFAIRMAEMKSSWAQNKENMLLSLANLKESYQAHLQELKALNETDLQLDELCAQQLYLENALHEEDHAIHTLSERFDEYSVVLSTKEGALEAVQEKLGECVQWQHAHQYMIKAIKEDKLQAMCTEISQPHGLSLACFNLVTDFLNSAGQGPLVLQCETTSAELISAVHQRQVIVRSCLDVLHTYATIISNYPERFLEDSRTSRCLKWLQELEQTMTIDKCKEIESDFEQQFGTVHFTAAQMQAVLTRESSIQKIYVDVNDKLVALVQRRSQETADTSILTGQVQDTATSVHSFMQENGYEGTVCMTSVVVTALSSLSKRYLIMEGAAAGAGERLMDLTSREGDWFLDELCSMSGNVSQLLGLLNDPAVTQILSAEICLQISQAVQSVHKLYASLQDLNVNFRNIILPETLKTLQLKEPSVLATIERLNKIVDDSGKTLDEWMDQLESQLRDAVMGMFSGDDNTLTAIDKMKSDFDDLLSINSSFDMSRDLTQGQMLLMGFNGLFTQLNSDFHSMQEAVAKIHTPDLWKKIDVVKEAKSIQFTAFNEHTIGLLTNLVFVKQLEAMTSFFKLAQEVAIGLQDFNSGTIRDGESLAGPIKLFIAEYVRKNLIGLPSQTLGYVLCHYMTALCIDVTAEIELRDIGATSKVSLEDLSKKAVDTNISNKVFGPLMLSQAGAIVASNDVAWRKSDLALRLDKNIHLLEQSRQRAQLQLARFQWLHEDCLTQAGRTVNQLAVPVRVTVIGELQKGIQALRHQDSVVKSKQEVHVQLEASVNQRLKWAAGANPSLNQILHQFDEHLTNKNDLIQRESRLTEDIVTIGNAILHLEALRSDMPEALAADTAFSTLLSRCEEAAALQVACKVSVSDQERSILQSYPVEPGQDLDETWINAKITDIQVQTNLHQENQEQKMNLVEASKDRIQGTVNEIRNVLTMHHKLMSDIRTILKSMAKQEEQDYGNDIKAGGIREYVNNYKMFSENFTMMMKSVITEDLTDNQGKDIEESISSLEAHTAKIYDALMTFVPPLTCEPSPEVAPTFASTVKNSEAMVAASPKKVPLSVVTKADLLSSHSPQATGSALPMKIEGPSKKADKVPRDPRTGKALQERNSYAVGVWRRVKTKLDGRDPDLSKRLSVAEQVDYVIKEATSQDNLAVLYEGWTPWV